MALARRLGQTRQATSELVRGLVRHDLLELGNNPDRRGGRLVVLTDRGRAMVRDAGRLLSDLETAVGADRVQALRALLAEVVPDGSEDH